MAWRTWEGEMERCCERLSGRGGLRAVIDGLMVITTYYDSYTISRDTKGKQG